LIAAWLIARRAGGGRRRIGNTGDTGTRQYLFCICGPFRLFRGIGVAMAKPRVGRPPKGRDVEGRPVSTRSYPQLTARIRPDIKAEVELLSALEKRSQAEVIERAVEAYAKSLPAAARKTLEGLRALRQDAAR